MPHHHDLLLLSDDDFLGKAAKRLVVSITQLGFGHVDVESRVISLYPVLPGEVTEVPNEIKENAAVKKGAILFRLDDVQAKLNVQLAKEFRPMKADEADELKAKTVGLAKQWGAHLDRLDSQGEKERPLRNT